MIWKLYDFIRSVSNYDMDVGWAVAVFEYSVCRGFVDVVLVLFIIGG